MIDWWWKLNLLTGPAKLKLSPEEQAGEMQKSIERLVLSLYRRGYDPAVIARTLTANAVAFVIDCSGPEQDHARLMEIVAALEEKLKAEYFRRMISPPYDRVARFARRHEI
jgi:hypothetical protein